MKSTFDYSEYKQYAEPAGKALEMFGSVLEAEGPRRLRAAGTVIKVAGSALGAYGQVNRYQPQPLSVRPTVNPMGSTLKNVRLQPQPTYRPNYYFRASKAF